MPLPPWGKERNRMKITREAGYAIELLVALDGQTNVRTLAALAAETRTPRPEARRIMDRLRRAGLVQGRRGRTGGYLAGRPLEKITLAQVLAAVHGTFGHPADAPSELVRSVAAFVDGRTREALAATVAQFVGTAA